MTTTMICLVSKEPMPNLRLILCKTPDFGVSRVILIVSNEMEETAEGLEKVLKRHNIDVDTHKIENAYDYGKMSSDFLELINSVEDKAVVNITGGTKIMSLALCNAARNTKKVGDIIYVRNDNHNGVRLKGDSEEFDIDAKMSLDDILDAHNYEQNSPSSFTPDKKQQAFARMLLERYYDKPDIIALLNKVSYSESSRKKNIKVYFEDSRITENDLKKLYDILKKAKEAKLLEECEDYLLFPTKNKRKFVCGGWFETAVEEVIKEIQEEDKNLIEDVKAGVSIRGRNEMDVLVSRSKGLAVIECKTSAYKKKHGQREIDVMKQIKEQQSYGGLTTLNILVSINEIKNPHALEGVEREGIKIIDADKLVNLKERLIEYLK